MRKSVAGQIVGAQMVSATDGSAFTGAVTCYVTIDGGTQAQGSVGSGACTHEGNGFHTYAPSQAETNGDHIAFTFIGTGAVPVTVQVYTTFPQTGDSYARIGAAGVSLTAIPWNSAWDAEVQSEAADALNAYDPPTKAELDAAAATFADAVWDEDLSGHTTSGTGGKILGDAATVLPAIKAKTDSLNFGVTGVVNANITHVNETEVTGDGAEGSEWGPAA